MENILEKIAESTRKRVEAAKERVPADKMKAEALAMPKLGFEFEKALKKPGISFICECKKASPSKGLISEDFPYLDIAREYEAYHADCISVLTEPEFFLGSTEYLREIAAAVKIPCIRKDFTIDEYMIYEARTLGASAVLLICSLLGEDRLREYIGICDTLGLSALVEAHDENEIRAALNAGARVIGVNNRDLKNFSVSTDNAVRLRKLVPENVVFVAESGIRSAEDIEVLKNAGVNAVLVGETLMRAKDRGVKLRELRGDKMPKIKICGIMREEDCLFLNSLEELMPDMAGFIFWEKSRRYITPETALKFRNILDRRIKTVGVFVDEKPDRIIEIAATGAIDVIQLHGDEDFSTILYLKMKTGLPIMKAYTVGGAVDIAPALRSNADMLLLDNGRGTGESFDWDNLEDVDRLFYLAGGLDPDNVGDAVRRYTPYGVDVSTGVETDGKKDYDKIRRFIHTAKTAGVF